MKYDQNQDLLQMMLQEAIFSVCKLRSAVLMNWQAFTGNRKAEAELQIVPINAHSYPHYNMAWGLEHDSIFFSLARP